VSDSAHRRWQFWIDVGGTFTDCLARAPDGELRSCKVLSSGRIKASVVERRSARSLRVAGLDDCPEGFFVDYRAFLLQEGGEVLELGLVTGFGEGGVLELDSEAAASGGDGGTRLELTAGEPAPILGMRRLLGLPLGASLGAIDVRLGTTRATNALLERRGARTGLLITEGFADLLRIGNQSRPKLFELDIRKPEVLYETVREVRERLDPTGDVLAPLDGDGARESLSRLRRDGVRSLAICLLHAYRNGRHERRLEELAREVGFDYVALSSQVSPTIKIVPRAETTVVDAYLTPVIRDYVRAIGELVPEGRLRLMTSAGGLVAAAAASGKDTLLSGPAGGVVGLAGAAEEAGFERAVGFDMGGTSTDVSRYDGEFAYEFETEKAGVRIAAPMLAIETVAAGGGSICAFDGQKLVVGPRSAGAEPGPACYGRGGPLAVTDVNLWLGRILPSYFPFDLDREAVVRRLDEVADEVARTTGQRRAPQELAEGFVRIANANMAAAIKKISIARGYDVRDYVLVSFGGAGGQHACAVARELGIRRILLHPFAGVLSAWGMGVADVKRFGVRTILAPLGPQSDDEVSAAFLEMHEELRGEILAEGVPEERIRAPRRQLELRYVGQSSTLLVDYESGGDPAVELERLHRQLYGHAFSDRPLEVVAARLELVARMERARREVEEEHRRRPEPATVVDAVFDGELRRTPVHLRDHLRPGDELEGPAIVVEITGTDVVEPGWTCRLTGRRDLVLEDRRGRESETVSAEVDPVQLEVFHNQFAAIAEQMGATLVRTSLSVNVKERLDFSCAVFTGRGDLVANAPHMPVHLGAMSETVKWVLREMGELEPGDVVATNDPLRGGSHLPDITVVTPVFDEQGSDILFFTASRAHHAELGGIRPGSMPPDSRTLAEEGVLIRNFEVVKRGEPRFEALRRLLEEAPYPSRSPDENLADVGAQVSANHTGAEALLQMLERYGRATTLAYMDHIQRAAENKMRAALRRLGDGRYAFADSLDDGARIVVEITIDDDEAVIDFTGTSPPLESNLNANVAIVKAAVIYVLRCLIDEEIPLNDGVLAPVRIVVPPSLLNPPFEDDPRRCVAVVGGNVETSQRVTDVLLAALGMAAASQGTMNNLTFGNERFGYYETICGGAGAGPGFDGADAVHTHMTNTRLTDPEVLEAQYPVRLRRFEIRRGSGGAGRYRGGDGVRRELELLEPLQVSILSQRRRTRPFGLRGGESGKAGRNVLLRRRSEREDEAFDEEELSPVASVEGGTGDRFLVETPGGGGYGAPVDDADAGGELDAPDPTATG
jgi:5-oxoprolinase (ATP-hydrolysing)